MKKIIAMLLTLLLLTGVTACGASSWSKGSDSGEYKIAMITTSGDVTDMSFNQTTYEASKEFAEERGVHFQYYNPPRTLMMPELLQLIMR
ncbi:hypothetical protein [Butyrivibrio sp. INlla16]|uniref:hypothetical protein n=1 Tax=Butyrivibrio sp. INlla16 TaxID=1520807 RepID=UPI0008924025|nr:hypothetical protein [Butyrivibrio sp. INlla16]SDB24189.1 basic membrane protein A [Butyrivibrio sp. INlla16]